MRNRLRDICSRYRIFILTIIGGFTTGAAATFWLSAADDSASSRMSPGHGRLDSLIRHCAPNVSAGLMLAIIRTESSFKPFALNVNGNIRLARAPRSLQEAQAWSSWLISQGYSVDMGYMQINSLNLARLKLTPGTVFDPCVNIRAGAAILTEQYGRASRRYGGGHEALLAAISAYNTGNFRDGFRNGYVVKVVNNTKRVKARNE